MNQQSDSLNAIDTTNNNNNNNNNNDDLRQLFIPEEHGLDAGWRLTKFSDLKG